MDAGSKERNRDMASYFEEMALRLLKLPKEKQDQELRLMAEKQAASVRAEMARLGSAGYSPTTR